MRDVSVAKRDDRDARRGLIMFFGLCGSQYAKKLNVDGNQEILVKRAIGDGTAITERHVGMMRRLKGKATVGGLDVEIKPWNLADVRNANMWIL